jgi:hypothetical protein
MLLADIKVVECGKGIKIEFAWEAAVLRRVER